MRLQNRNLVYFARFVIAGSVMAVSCNHAKEDPALLSKDLLVEESSFAGVALEMFSIGAGIFNCSAKSDKKTEDNKKKDENKDNPDDYYNGPQDQLQDFEVTKKRPKDDSNNSNSGSGSTLGIGGVGADGADGDNADADKKTTPCDRVSSLSNNTNFKDWCNALKNITKDKSIDQEVAKVQYKDKETFPSYFFPANVGSHDSAGVSFPLKPIEWIMHTHYDGTLSVFSVTDLYTLAELYDKEMIGNTSTFSYGIITASGTQYILMIEDLDKFQVFAQDMLKQDIRKYTDKFLEQYNVKEQNSKDVNEEEFLRYLQDKNTGLKLFKGNETFDKWEPLKVDKDKKVVPNPC